MARAAVLTDARIRDLAVKPKRYSVHDALVPGLLVRVYPSGRRSLMLTAVYPGHPDATRRQLGIWGQLLIEPAREKARRWIAWIEKGLDPAKMEAEERRANLAQQATTFEAVAEDYIKLHVQGQRQAKRVEQEIRSELIPAWKGRPITAIKRADMVRLIEAIRDRAGHRRKGGKAIAYSHSVFGHVRGIWNWAITRGVYEGLEASPTDRVKPGKLIGKKRARKRLLTEQELAAFWWATGEMGYPNGHLYRFLMLTGGRLREGQSARWREMTKLDVPGEALFTVPETRFKSETPHLVPLSQAALDVLAACPRFRTGDHVFSVDFGATPISNFDRALKRLRKLMLKRLRETDPAYEMEHFIPHDFRRAIRSHLSMMKFREPVCEAVIGHGRKGLARIYDVHSMLPEIREALDAWALRLLGIANPQPNVASLDEARQRKRGAA